MLYSSFRVPLFSSFTFNWVNIHGRIVTFSRVSTLQFQSSIFLFECNFPDSSTRFYVIITIIFHRDKIVFPHFICFGIGFYFTCDFSFTWFSWVNILKCYWNGWLWYWFLACRFVFMIWFDFLHFHCFTVIEHVIGLCWRDWTVENVRSSRRCLKYRIR